ncbi:MAG TPA: hypothetical protein VFI09_02600 [Solirubrobacterales bacterium]|nr:hypothetical protein [Solirubrobacterales bacterium]
MLSVFQVALGLGGALLIGVGAVFLSVLRALLTKEAQAVVPALSRNLLRQAVERLPTEHRSRFQEEWAAELGDAIEERPLWALLESASLYQRAGRIAAELEPVATPVRARGGSRPSAVLMRLDSATQRALGRVRSLSWVLELTFEVLLPAAGTLLALFLAGSLLWQLGGVAEALLRELGMFLRSL